jgi:hypothetical protein
MMPANRFIFFFIFLGDFFSFLQYSFILHTVCSDGHVLIWKKDKAINYIYPVSCCRRLIISGVIVVTGDKLIASVTENSEQGLVTGVNDTGNNLYIAGVIDTG